MEAPSSGIRRNLESIDQKWAIDGWDVTALVDPISEKRYLLWRPDEDTIAGIASDAIMFRLAAASAICPRCLTVVELSDSPRLEILTEAASPVDLTATTDDDARAFIYSLIGSLANLERAAFPLPGIVSGALAVAADGTARGTPAALAIPPTGAQSARIQDLGAVLRGLVTSLADGSKTAARLIELADGIDDGTVATFSAAEALINDTPATSPQFVPGATTHRNDAARIREIRDLLEANSIIEISGPGGAGKSATLDALHQALIDAGEFVTRVDEWTFHSPPRRRGSTKDVAAPAGTWLVDNITEHPAIYGELFRRLANDRDATIVWTRDPDRSGPATAALSGLGSRAARGTGVVALDPDPDHSTALHLAQLALRAGATSVPEDIDGAAASLCATLDDESHHIMQLCAVAGMALPLPFLVTIFPGPLGPFARRLHHLAAIGAITLRYRSLPPNGAIGAAVGFSSASVRSVFYNRIPEARRLSLHRTIARAGADIGFPPVFVYQHLRAAAEDRAALRAGVTFLRESDREQRIPFLDNLVSDFADNPDAASIPFGDRTFALLRVGGDLLARGRNADAERILTTAREQVARPEALRRHAALLSEVARLLADTWAARSHYTAALEMLYETREDLSTYMSLAEQSQLMNEIGWLQYRLGEYDRAMESCKLGLTSLSPNEHPLVVAQALNLMGVIHFNTSRYDEAIAYYEQSAILREKEGDRNALAGSYNNLALAYQARGEYDKALAQFDRSLDIKKLENNEPGVSSGYLNKALLYLEVHNFDEAERICRASLAIATQLGISQLIAENHSTLGDIAFTRGRYIEAENAYRKSLALARSLETTNEEMRVHRRLARLYLTTNRPDEARDAVTEASRLGEQIGSRYESAQIEDVLGDLEMAEHRYSRAIEHFEHAANLYTALSKFRPAATSLARIGHALANDDNHFEARRYLDRALDLSRSAIGHDVADEIVTLQQILRDHPSQAQMAVTGTPSDDAARYLHAFHELSSLHDHAEDRGTLLTRLVATFQQLTGATSCRLALSAEGDSYTSLSGDGEHGPLVDPGLRAVCGRALQSGSLLTSASDELRDTLANTPHGEGMAMVFVPMRSTGREIGCFVAEVPASTLPLERENHEFLLAAGRYAAGALRLTSYLEEHAHKEETLEAEYQSLKEQVVDRYHLGNLVGKDESMKKIFRMLEKIKEMDTGILVIGESGTGKTELARAIHYSSPRRRHNFQQIHCAEIPTNLLESELFGHEKGAFTGAVQRKLGRCEVANGGTIFLDDVNVMPIDTQAKLLQYLESKSFIRLGGTQKISTDVRIIAASNEDLEKLVKESRFREDLFYRLKVIQVELPPLRERPEDLLAIAQAYLKRRCHAQGRPIKTLTAETIKLFRRYSWPGNVRELQNILEQVVLLSDGDLVEPSSLPEDFLKRAVGPGRQNRQNLESLAEQIVSSEDYSEAAPLMPQLEALLARKMADHADNKSRAASLLGITKPTLYNRLRGYRKLN